MPLTEATSLGTLTRFELLIHHGRDWVPLETVTPEMLLDGWLAEPRLTCCSFQGGLFIDIDGKPWSDAGTVDEFWMTMFWFDGITKLRGGERTYGAWADDRFGGKSRATCGPWEESSLVLTLDRDILEMVDIHHSGHVSMRAVAVEFADFARRLDSVRAPFASLLRSCRDLAHERLPPSDNRLKTLDENLLSDDDHAKIAASAG